MKYKCNYCQTETEGPGAHLNSMGAWVLNIVTYEWPKCPKGCDEQHKHKCIEFTQFGRGEEPADYCMEPQEA